MQFGVFASEIKADSPAELFQKIKDYGFSCIQFDYQSVCKETLTQKIVSELNSQIAAEITKYNIEIAAINSNLNISHTNLKQFELTASSCKDLSCPLITLSTALEPNNNTQETWKDLCRITEQCLKIADTYNINIGIEIDTTHIINTPQQAKKFLDELKSHRLKIILDVANLFQNGTATYTDMKIIIGNAFELIGRDIALVHVKDVKSGNGLEFVKAGNGIIDYHILFEELIKVKYTGDYIIHTFEKEKNVLPAADFFRQVSVPHQQFLHPQHIPLPKKYFIIR
ncbi:hypothetical protein FACS1894190_02290 [Spirochaetia bacterium]|nr:hypothetical protein FACS1894190_02290 [Spirochaetia bacterium]